MIALDYDQYHELVIKGCLITRETWIYRGRGNEINIILSKVKNTYEKHRLLIATNDLELKGGYTISVWGEFKVENNKVRESAKYKFTKSYTRAIRYIQRIYEKFSGHSSSQE